jgi:hypothetical protein
MERYPKLLLVAGVLSLVPLIASAHERQVFRIGGRVYTFVVGFLNEPVFAGDKSGLDLRIRLADPKAPFNFFSPNVKPVEKLETSLKVEISAGGKKKVLGLEPAFRDPGVYRATFFPTAVTTYRFRLFGEMNGTPVDLAFTCNAGDGHPRPAEDRSEVKLSDRVTRIFKSGAFECPEAKGAVEFP